ncbi:unnamed protein product [Rhizoctonia solani]|uniref:Transmembrane protein n=1 Tax=Rhizoctonia solani TaxID=456999 RepID=A0A8H3DLB3_9AGAM|nr:unnamed protein product [Rhizoctonia solani]
MLVSTPMSLSGPYTDHPTQLAGMVFPNQSMQALSSVIHLFGCSVIAFCFARRTTGDAFFSWQTWLSMSWPRLCVLLVFLDSWLFLFSTGILITGVGMSSSFINCSLGIYACILLYAGSKILIYFFLIEKVHVVWGGTHQPRLHSKVYWGCLLTLAPYGVIVILMIIGRVAYFRDNRSCVIGLRNYASLSLLIYDLYINIFLTGMFLWPLFRSRLSNPKLKRMAMRTLVAAFAALTTSTINITVLTIMQGQQLGWVCLGSCGTDVMVNALVLFWVTDNISQTGSENAPGTHCPTAVPGAPVISNQSSAVEEGMKSPTFAQDRATTMSRRTGNSNEPVLFGKPAGRRNKGFVSKIGEALRGRKDGEGDDRRHQLSVQVTITTEQQGDIMMHDVDYTPRPHSINESIGTSRIDVEKGDMIEEEKRNNVELPGHGRA